MYYIRIHISVILWLNIELKNRDENLYLNHVIVRQLKEQFNKNNIFKLH